MIDCLVLVAPSAAGKSTLLNRLMKDFPGRFGYSVSHTTRGPRPGEVPGESYHFVDEATFKHMMAENAFLETAIVHNTTYYGTSFRSLRDVASSGKIAAMDLDIQGAQSMRAQAPSLRSCMVYIQVPSFEVLEQRLRSRNTETEDKIQVRMASARKEEDFFQANRAFFDIELMNDNLDECYAKFRREINRICFGVVEPKETTKQNNTNNSSNNKIVHEESPDAAAVAAATSKDGSAASKQKKMMPGSEEELGRDSGDTVAASIARASAASSSSSSGAEADDDGASSSAVSASICKAKIAAAGAAANSSSVSAGKENRSQQQMQEAAEEEAMKQVARPLVQTLENAAAPRIRERDH